MLTFRTKLVLRASPLFLINLPNSRPTPSLSISGWYLLIPRRTSSLGSRFNSLLFLRNEASFLSLWSEIPSSRACRRRSQHLLVELFKNTFSSSRRLTLLGVVGSSIERAFAACSATSSTLSSSQLYPEQPLGVSALLSLPSNCAKSWSYSFATASSLTRRKPRELRIIPS